MANETTQLTPLQETLFRKWAAMNNVKGYDESDSHYDMRGFWNNVPLSSAYKPGEHFNDLYKQHGHPTFSQESQYSSGPSDGGMWIGQNKDHFLAQPPMAISHKVK